MSYLAKAARRGALLLAVALVAGCATPPPPAPSRTAVPAHDMVAAVRAAGDRESSVIAVNPLGDPGVTGLQDAARADANAGRYADAAAKLDQALKLSPDSPALLQDRAEIAIRLGDFSGAEKLAHRSWSLGPKLGPLCARNWQTIVELRQHADDENGAATARKWLGECHKAAVPRY
ncbi:tetratricopeptide repeat protein [Rhodanobacter caeni]|uniref:Tetratricopeptide repeat protein n=1 Tax=Rhodanobacter caeni TaxID=657654 RepID=A0ABN0UQ88_9GAMM